MGVFVIVVNNHEAEANGDESTAEDVKYEVGELLRSGYYEVEHFYPIEEYPEDD